MELYHSIQQSFRVQQNLIFQFTWLKQKVGMNLTPNLLRTASSMHTILSCMIVFYSIKIVQSHLLPQHPPLPKKKRKRKKHMHVKTNSSMFWYYSKLSADQICTFIFFNFMNRILLITQSNFFPAFFNTLKQLRRSSGTAPHGDYYNIYKQKMTCYYHQPPKNTLVWIKWWI